MANNRIRIVKFWSVLMLGCLVILVTACDSKSAKKSGSDSDVNSPPVIAVSNYPLKFFTEQIAGDRVTVVFPVESGIDPAFWEPSSSGAVELQKADRVFLNGAGYESWLNSVTLIDSRLVDTTAAIHDQLIEMEESMVHQHGPEGEHTHKKTAFTTWLDIDVAIAQARVIRDELSRLQPDGKADFNSGFLALEKRLHEIKGQLAKLAPSLADQHLMASHPVYQYLQREMGLNMHSVHFEPDENPDENQWTAFDEMVKANPTQIMLWEGEPLGETRTELESRGIRVVLFEPLGNQPDRGDFVSRMTENIKRLATAVQ